MLNAIVILDDYRGIHLHVANAFVILCVHFTVANEE